MGRWFYPASNAAADPRRAVYRYVFLEAIAMSSRFDLLLRAPEARSLEAELIVAAIGVCDAEV